MNWGEALLLGIFQGITEFLPVSSSGHLALAEHFFNLPAEKFLPFDAVLHGGTLLALFVLFWREIWDFLGVFLFPKSAKPETKKMLGLLILATLPAAAIGFFFADFFESFRSTKAIGFFFIISALVFLAAETRFSQLLRHKKETTEISLRVALSAGIFQIFALFSGISRSGITTAAGLFCGVRREVATRFSFLMGLPIIFAAAGLQVAEIIQHKSPFDFGILEIVVGFLTSALVGFFFARFLLGFFKRFSLRGFAFYLLGSGFFTLLF